MRNKVLCVFFLFEIKVSRMLWVC